MNRQLYLTALSLSLITLPLAARTWTSDDGSKTFEGKFVSFDKESNLVTVMRGIKKLKFPIDKLSEADQDWLEEAAAKEAERAAEANKEKVEDQVIGSKLTSKVLTRLDGKRFKRVELEGTPEYYILYFSASW